MQGFFFLSFLFWLWKFYYLCFCRIATVFTIEKLSSYLGVPARKIIKAVLYVVNGKDLVMFMIRGDRNVDEN